MSILVIGGTGMVGGHVVRGLLTKGEAVRVLSRPADHADAPSPGANGIIGDLRKPETLRWPWNAQMQKSPTSRGGILL